MNNYCYKFEHSWFKLPSKEQLFPDGVIKLQSIMDLHLLDPAIHNFFKMANINIRWIELNYRAPQPAYRINSKYGSLHADGDVRDNRAKINFVVGGTNSQMIWYDFVDQNKTKSNILTTSIYSSSLNPKDKVKEVHREQFRAAIVNVGQFHSVENTIDERICIQCIIEDCQTKERLNYFEAVERFQSIEHLINSDKSLSL